MNNFELNFEETISYKKRKQKRLILYLIFLPLIIPFTYYSNDWQEALIFDAFYGLAFIFRNSMRSRFFINYGFRVNDYKIYINSIKLNNGFLEIKFKDNDEEKIIKGDAYEFEFKKGSAIISAPRNIDIYQNKKFILRQYRVDDWNEALMDDLVEKMKEYQPK